MPDFQHSKDLREERAGLAHKMQELAQLAHKEGRSLNGDERNEFDAMSNAVDELADRIETMERAERVQEDPKTPAAPRGRFLLDDGRMVDKMPADRDKIVTRRDADLAMRAWGLRGGAPDEFQQAAKKVGMDVGSQQIRVNLADTYSYRLMREQFRRDGIVYRATTPQSKGTNAKGGFTVPTELSRTIEEAMLWYGGMRNAATIIRTEGGHNLNIATADDTTTVASVLAENTAAAVSDLTFAQVTYYAAKYSSGIVLASIELLQDTAVDLIDYVGRALGTRLARGTNRDYTTGSTATTSPRGILRGTVQGYPATTATGNISLTTLTEMVHSVDIEYRNMGSAFMCHDGIIKSMRQLVDSNGQPLWQVSLRVGEPDRMLGYPLIINNRLASSTTATGATNVLLFGALSKYIIRDVMGIDIIRFDERYMNALQVGWLGVLRTDGQLLTASTVAASKPVKHLKTAT